MKRTGFTLLELAIVLVVIALVVGGIFAGRELIRDAQLRKAGSTANEFVMRMRVFKEKFGQYPGDTTRAWSLWGGQCALTQAICNGDGNGIISSRYYSAVESGVAYAEDECLMRQLYLAGLYTNGPTIATCNLDHVEGVILANMPYHPYIIPRTVDSMYMHIAAWNLYGHKGNAVTITTFSTLNAGIYLNGGTLTRDDARRIDTKFDDGNPATGTIFASYQYGGTSCLNVNSYTAAPNTVSWNSSNTAGCNLHFWID